MVDTNIRPAYVDVAEVCRDWGCSRSKGYAIIKQLSEQMKSENPRLLTMSGKIDRIYYEEACMRRQAWERAIKKALAPTRARDTYIAICIVVKESIA